MLSPHLALSLLRTTDISDILHCYGTLVPWQPQCYVGGSIFKLDGILGGIFSGFMWDPDRVTLELSRDPNVIILAS